MEGAFLSGSLGAMPFKSSLAAPSWEAEIGRIIQAAVPSFALFLARSDSFPDPSQKTNL